MSNILNPQRLTQLSQFHPKLKNVWYLIAAVTCSVCNAPQEVPLIYHYSLMLNRNSGDSITNITKAEKAVELVNKNKSDLKTKLDTIYSESNLFDKKLTEKMREALLKTGPLAGLPKAINSLSALAQFTPKPYVPIKQTIDPFDSNALDTTMYSNSVQRLKHQNEVLTDENAITRRGLNHWNEIYSKVSSRVSNNLNAFYPDLWYYTLFHVYGPLFSFDEVVDEQETSLIIIAALVPQDVNPQLKGHLKGAVNIGCDPEVVEAARNLAMVVSEWCGIKWKSGVVRL